MRNKIMKNMIVWIAGAFVGFCLLVFLVSIGHGFYVQHKDRLYHAELPKTLQLSCAAFEHHGMIPAEFSCEQNGGGSPPLAWTDAPDGAKSFALIVTDPDIPSATIKVAEFTHWVLYNIPFEVRALSARISYEELGDSNVSVGKNGAGRKQFYPPCPLSGTHDYLFRLYALDVENIRPKTENKRGILAEIEGHVLAYGELTGKYQNQKLDFKAAMGWNMTRMTQTR